jgi:flagellar biosynthetic protein FliR
MMLLDTSISLYQSYMVVIGLLLIRCSAAFMMVPVIGGESLPMRYKAAVAGMMALVLLPTVDPRAYKPELWMILGGAVGEMMIGLCMGLVVRLIIFAAEFAGGALGLQMGLAFSQVVDPVSKEQGPTTSRLLGVVATLVLVALDGHRTILASVAQSITAIPLGEGLLQLSSVDTLVGLLSTATVVGVRIAAPVVVSLFIGNVALGLLARAAPQLQLFILSFGLSIGFGLLLLANTSRQMILVFSQRAHQLSSYVAQAVGM